MKKLIEISERIFEACLPIVFLVCCCAIATILVGLAYKIFV